MLLLDLPFARYRGLFGHQHDWLVELAYILNQSAFWAGCSHLGYRIWLPN
jgi:hypothetical protein